MKDANDAAADRRSGQVSMFDAMGGGDAEETVPESDGIDDTIELSSSESLALEHEVLGYYLTATC